MSPSRNVLGSIASQGEFDLNAFFEAKGTGAEAEFVHRDNVQKWPDIIRGSYSLTQVDALKVASRPPFPYSDTRLLPYLQHSIWMLPRTASCAAMLNLLGEKQNVFWHDYSAVNVSAPGTGTSLDALPSVREAIGSGHDSTTITLTVGKLTTGVTVKQWSSILLLRNLKAPELYFQAAFRVQSSWTITNPNGDDPSAEKAAEELVKLLPVLAYDGSNMTQVDAGGIPDIALVGTSATLLARTWESAVLVNVDN